MSYEEEPIFFIVYCSLLIIQTPGVAWHCLVQFINLSTDSTNTYTLLLIIAPKESDHRL